MADDKRRVIRFSKRMFLEEADFPVPAFGDGVVFRMRVEHGVDLADWHEKHAQVIGDEKASREVRHAFIREHVINWTGLRDAEEVDGVVVEGDLIPFGEAEMAVLAKDPDVFLELFKVLMTGTKFIQELNSGN